MSSFRKSNSNTPLLCLFASDSTLSLLFAQCFHLTNDQKTQKYVFEGEISIKCCLLKSDWSDWGHLSTDPEINVFSIFSWMWVIRRDESHRDAFRVLLLIIFLKAIKTNLFWGVSRDTDLWCDLMKPLINCWAGLKSYLFHKAAHNQYVPMPYVDNWSPITFTITSDSSIIWFLHFISSLQYFIFSCAILFITNTV